MGLWAHLCVLHFVLYSQTTILQFLDCWRLNSYDLECLEFSCIDCDSIYTMHMKVVWKSLFTPFISDLYSWLVLYTNKHGAVRLVVCADWVDQDLLHFTH